MKKIAVFPGSFDPITKGHESILQRAIPLFDKIIVLLGENSDKKTMFSKEQRIKWIEKTFANFPNIEVASHSGLTVDFCKKVGADFILRGLRTSSDFEFERSIAQANKKLYPNIETIFILTLPEHTFITSTIVRDIIRHNGDTKDFIPDAIEIKTNL